jgi:glycerophosphoryl diester phosphodiesterase
MVRMKKLVFLLICCISCLAQTAGTHRTIRVIAHRGEHLHAPENTLAAFRGAVEAGADYFETDVRTTSDGKLVLMHDSTVDRMTNGQGDVASMTYEAIGALEVGLKMGPNWAGTRVPTFDEALRFAREHGIGIYVDSKRLTARDAVDAIARHGMQDRVVVYGGAAYLKDVAALNPKLRVMPEANNAATLKSLLETMSLKVAAFDAKDFTDETIAVAHAAGVDIFVDRLGPADNPSSWQDAIDRGAAGIQTDKPAELVRYLKERGYRAADRP